MSRFKSFLAGLMDYLPKAVPTTDAGVQALISRVCLVAGIPLNPSTQQAIAVMLQGLLRNSYRISLNRVVKELRRGMANQALFNAVQDARSKEKGNEAIKEVN